LSVFSFQLSVFSFGGGANDIGGRFVSTCDMRKDLLFSLRELRKHPGLVVTSILSLTLGIGATSAVFSVIYALLGNPYPYLGAERMIELNVINEKGQFRFVGVTGPQLAILRQMKCMESVAATGGGWNLTTTDEDLPEDVQSSQLSGNAGAHFGVAPVLGRTIIPSDAPDGQDPEPVVVLSYRFWRRHFNSDPMVVGRKLQLVHKTYTIVGVMPSRFTIGDADVYLPMKITNDPSMYFFARLRLRPGVTHEAANAELQPVLEQFAKAAPNRFPKQFRVHVRGMIEKYMDSLGPPLFLLLGAVALLLLIGCGNVSILLLARGTARQHELAIRSAIGASRWRIQRQLLTEALALSVSGAIGGVLLAYGLIPLMVRWLPEYSFPHEVVMSVNLPVLGFAVALAIVTGVLFGLAPAFEVSRPELAPLMQSGSRRTTDGGRSKATHRLLVAGQIALTLLLLTSAGAAMNGFLRLVNTQLGYDPRNAMSVGIPVHQNSHIGWEDRANYFDRLLQRISAMPEVVAAGISSNATPPNNGWETPFEIFGRPSSQQERLRANFISPEYFAVLHIPLLQGRLMDQSEVMRGARLAVINQTMASQYWPTGGAVGQQLRIPDLKSEPPFRQVVKDGDQWIQVIGVVADARDDGLRRPIKAAVYLPYTVQMGMYTQILVRTRSAPLAALNHVRAEVKAVDPEQQVVGQTRDLEQWIREQEEYSFGRLVAALFSGFSLVALALAAVGLFSVVSYGVAQRTNEFGIRMALGATRSGVVTLVLASTASQVVGGVVCGVVLSLSSSRVLSKWTEGSVQSAVVFTGVTVVLIVTAALAALIPACRASSVDPMAALRYE
jgi:predicted permease